MVKIRLFRTGTNKKPLYRLVAVDQRKKRQGRVLEMLGTYDPRGGGKVTVDRVAVNRWVGQGAQLSDTVGSLLRKLPAEAPAAPTAAV